MTPCVTSDLANRQVTVGSTLGFKLFKFEAGLLLLEAHAHEALPV
jgi:hypothetical protein